MALIHFGIWNTLQAIDIADISNSDTAYIYYNERNHLMQFNSTATNAENNSTRPYHLRPHDYATAGVWVEQIGNDYDAYSGNQIKTGAIESLNWIDGTSGMRIDLDNELIAIKDDTFGNAGIQLGWISSAYKFYIGDGANKYFQWDGTNPTWKAANSELNSSGNLVCTGGTIGGFTLAATTLTATNLLLDAGNQRIQLGSGNDIVTLDAADATYRLAIGHATYASAPFRVTKAGALTATSGTIGGWTLGATSLTSTNIGLHSGASAQILLGHATDYASAKIGLKNDGSGKLASGNISWTAAGKFTINMNTDSSGNNAIYANSNRFIHNYEDPSTLGNNLFIGENAGNFTLARNGSLTNECAYNLGIGVDALKSLTWGYFNTCIGYKAGTSITYGSDNIFIGTQAGAVLTYGTKNICIGPGSAISLTIGCNNIFFGVSAGGYATTADSNICIGDDAGLELSTGSNNVAIGESSGYSLGDSEYNTFVGDTSGYACDGGDYNAAFGFSALMWLTTGSSNVAIGQSAGRWQNNGVGFLETPEDSIYIGARSKSGSDPSGGEDTIDNEIVIGVDTIGNGSDTVTLGNTSIGEFHCQVALTVDSDERIKRNISPALAGLSFINSLNPITFQMLNPADYPDDIKPCNFKDRIVKEKDPHTKKETEKLIKADPRPQDNDRKYIGLSAQDVERVMQEQGINIDSLVVTSNRGKKAITYENLIMPLIRAIQELSGKIDMIEERINH